MRVQQKALAGQCHAFGVFDAHGYLSCISDRGQTGEDLVQQFLQVDVTHVHKPAALLMPTKTRLRLEVID